MANTWPPPRAPKLQPMHISRVPYLPGLDGLRALAVIAVILYHSDLSERHIRWIPGGFLGVEVFFVISGYLITLLLVAEQERGAWIGRHGFWRRLKAFWLRRGRRLLPAVIVMIATVVTLSGLLGYLRAEVKLKLGWSPLFGVFYSSNWFQLVSGQSYAADLGRPPLLRHLWSLAVEEQFYLVWPIVMLLLLPRFWKRLPDLGLWIWGAAFGLWIISATLIAAGVNWNWIYLGTQSRAVGLLLGAGMAMFWRPLAISRSRLRKKGWMLSIVGLIGLVVLALCFWKLRLNAVDDPTKPYTPLFYGGLLLVDVATMMVIASATHLRSIFGQKVLGNPVLRYVGSRSYGLYLWHWPIFQLTRPDAPPVGDGDLSWPFWQVMLLRIALTLTVTEVSFRLIETPIRRGGFANWLKPTRVTSASTGRSRRRKGWIIAASVVLLPMLAGTRIVSAASRTQEQIAFDNGQKEACSVVEHTCAAATNAASLTTLPTTVPATTPPTTLPPTTLPPTTTSPTTTVAIEPTVAGSVAAADSGAPTGPGTTVAAAATEPSAPNPSATAAPLAVPTAVTAAPPAASTVAATVPPATTAPAAPTVPPDPRTLQILAIGDSVMLGAAPALTAQGVTVDAKQSRQFKEGVDIVTAAQAQGLLGKVLIIHLGTNGTMSASGIATMMAAAKDVPLVIFLTLHVPSKPWQDPNNVIIRNLPSQYPNVKVLDWQNLSEQQPGVFYTDAIHLRPAGQTYYTQLIMNMIQGRV